MAEYSRQLCAWRHQVGEGYSTDVYQCGSLDLLFFLRS
jgi:hypothetical protein